MKVAEAMTHQVHVINPQASLEEAVQIVTEHRIAGLPVVSKEGKLVGIISEKDILQALFPSIPEFMENPCAWLNHEGMESRIQNKKSLTVKKVMKSKVITVGPQTPVMKAISLMLCRQIRRLPVMEKDKLVGIITLGDAFQALFRKHLDLKS